MARRASRRRIALLEGLDDIGLTMKHAAGIDSWQARDRLDRPWIWDLQTADVPAASEDVP